MKLYTCELCGKNSPNETCAECNVCNTHMWEAQLSSEDYEKPVYACSECGVIKGEEKVKCNNCTNVYEEEQLLIIEDMRACSKCKTDEYLADLPHA